MSSATLDTSFDESHLKNVFLWYQTLWPMSAFYFSVLKVKKVLKISPTPVEVTSWGQFSVPQKDFFGVPLLLICIQIKILTFQFRSEKPGLELV